MSTLPYWNNDEVISSDKLNSMVQAIINGDPLAVKVSNATKNDVNQIVGYLSSLHDKAKTNLNSATSTSDLDTAYTNMTALVSNKLGSYANDDTVELYSTGIRASIIAFLQAYDNMMSNDRLNNKNTDNTLGSRIDSETRDRENADEALDTKIYAIQANGGGRNLLIGTSGDWVSKTGTGWLNATTANSNKTSVSEYHTGDHFTYSATIINKSNTPVRLELYCCDGNGTRLSGDSNRVLSDVIEPNPSFVKKISCTVAIDNNTWYVEHTLIADGSSTSKTVQIKGEMFEAGIIAHDWSPAPEDTNSAIENVNAKADDNTASISKITSNGGGRNLLIISSFDYGAPNFASTFDAHWHCGDNITWTFSEDKPITLADSHSLQFTPKSNLPNVDNGIWYIAPQVKAGEVYTFGFWGKSTSDGFKMEVESFSDISKFTMTTAWKYYSGQLKFASDNRNMYFRISEDNSANVGTVTIFHPMLEKGIVAHDWSPAPEDVQSQIDNLNANKANSSDVNWNLVIKNSSNTYNYASGSKITLPRNSSITVKDDRIIPRIYLPAYINDYLPNTDFNTLAIENFGEYDNLFIPSSTMATLTNRPINPDTNYSLTGDCFFSNHYAYSGTNLRVMQKIYSCDYNYVFIRGYNGSSNSWTNWSCLTPYA